MCKISKLLTSEISTKLLHLNFPFYQNITDTKIRVIFLIQIKVNTNDKSQKQKH